MKLPVVLIEELMAALPSAEIFIMHGQTEATARLSCRQLCCGRSLGLSKAIRASSCGWSTSGGASSRARWARSWQG